MSRKRTAGSVASIAILLVSALALCIAVAPASAKSLSAKQIANKVLKLSPRKPSDIDLFTSKFEPGGTEGIYPQGSAMAPASGTPLTEAQARSRLKSYLQDQLHHDSGKVNAALALFDRQSTKAAIPDPQIRAAFVGMKGTVLQPTIDHFLNSGKFVPIGYGGVPIGAVASSSGLPRQIVVSRRYQSEDFRYLIGIMGHEVLHDDASTTRAEEAILNSLTGMTYMQVLLRHPELAYKGTELSRVMDDEALLFLNTREKGASNSEVYAPTGKGVAPGGSTHVPDIWTFFGGDSATSPGSPPFGQITRSLGLPKASKFSLVTAKTFAHLNDKWLSDVGRLQISVLLQLVSVKTIADKANLSRSKAISKLHLRPYLDAIK
jgi:hypothetical protein